MLLSRNTKFVVPQANRGLVEKGALSALVLVVLVRVEVFVF